MSNNPVFYILPSECTERTTGYESFVSRVETESGGTRRRTGGEVKGKEANGVGSQPVFSLTRNSPSSVRAETECDGTRKRTGGEVKGEKGEWRG